MNPVKAHMVMTPEEYSHSSYKEFKSHKTKILHENALKLYEERFVGWFEYVEFHQKQAGKVFIGMQQEVYLQQKDLAWVILMKMQEKYQFKNLEEVIEETESRNEFMQRICDEIQVSISKMKKIYGEIKKELLEAK